MLHHAGRAVQDVFFSIDIPEPDEPDENNADMNNVYKVAVVKLNEHFTSHINVTYERSVFRSMCQLQGGSIDKYITRLKQKAQYCNFADESKMIRNHVIEKCTSHRLRRKLLERADLELYDVIKLAQTMELSSYADKQADAIEQGSSGHSQEKVGDQSHGAAVNRVKAKKATAQSQQKTC